MFEFRPGWLDLVSTGVFPRLILYELRRQGVDDAHLLSELSMSAAEAADLDRPWCFKELSLLVASAQSHTQRYLIFDDPFSVASRLAVGKVRLGAHLAKNFRESVLFISNSSAITQRYLSISLEEHEKYSDLVLTSRIELGEFSAFIHYFALVTSLQMLRFLVPTVPNYFELTLARNLDGSNSEIRKHCNTSNIAFTGTRTFIRYPKALNKVLMTVRNYEKFEMINEIVERSVRLPYCRITWGEKVRVLLLDSDLQITAQDISAQLGVTAKTLSNYLQKEGLTFRGLKAMMATELRILESSTDNSTQDAS